MLPAPLWLALVRVMLVVDDGTRITQLSLHGEGKEEAASPQKRKPTPPRCARQPLPKEGARVDTPSFLWKEVPRRGGGWMGKAVSPTQSLSQWGRLRYEDAAFLDTTLFPMGKAKRRRLCRKKGSQPRLAALGSPFQGKRLAWTLHPSNGEGCDTRIPLSPFCRIF